jgi:SAM-dependent methyltransferase
MLSQTRSDSSFPATIPFSARCGRFAANTCARLPAGACATDLRQSRRRCRFSTFWIRAGAAAGRLFAMRSGDALNSPRPTSLSKSPGKSPYQLDTCFDRRALQLPHGRRKAQLFAALIPAGCRSVLDAGGGTGWATIGLRQKCHVVTLDGAAESLRQATGDKVLGSVEALPFADRSFDLVISSQVLEHLPDRALDKTRWEMMRVARHYLLVSVPYRESLEAREVRCGVCRTVFHPDYHCRSLAEEDLAKLFPRWQMAEWHVFGPLRRGVGVVASRGWRRARDIQPAYVGTLCPQCGNQVHENPSFPPQASSPQGKRHIVRRILTALRERLRRYLGLPEGKQYATFLPQGVAPFWIAALFAREESSVPIDGDVGFIDECRQA